MDTTPAHHPVDGCPDEAVAAAAQALRDRRRRSGRPIGEEAERLRDGLGCRLRELRADGQWSLRELAQLVGTSHSTLSRLERGQLRPRRGTLWMISKALNPAAPSSLFSELCEITGESLCDDNARSKWRVPNTARPGGHPFAPLSWWRARGT